MGKEDCWAGNKALRVTVKRRAMAGILTLWLQHHQQQQRVQHMTISHCTSLKSLRNVRHWRWHVTARRWLEKIDLTYHKDLKLGKLVSCAALNLSV